MQHCFEELDETKNDYAKSMALSLKPRFLHLHLIFHERLGCLDQAGNHVVEPAVQRLELASLIGARPGSVSRLVQRLESEGLVEFDKRLVRFDDMDAVLREAGAQL